MLSEDELDMILDVVGIPGRVGFGETVRGKFTNPSRNAQIFDGEVNSQAPGFLVKASDLAKYGIDIGTLLTIGDVDYTVTDTDERDDGFVALPLTKA